MKRYHIKGVTQSLSTNRHLFTTRIQTFYSGLKQWQKGLYSIKILYTLQTYYYRLIILRRGVINLFSSTATWTNINQRYQIIYDRLWRKTNWHAKTLPAAVFVVVAVVAADTFVAIVVFVDDGGDGVVDVVVGFVVVVVVVVVVVEVVVVGVVGVVVVGVVVVVAVDFIFVVVVCEGFSVAQHTSEFQRRHIIRQWISTSDIYNNEHTHGGIPYL